MPNVTLCPKCGESARWSSYLNCYICAKCSYNFSYVPEYESHDQEIAALTAERDSLKAQFEEKNALIEELHDLLEGVDSSTDGEALGFDLVAIRKFLKGHKYTSRKDVALATMRAALTGLIEAIRDLEGDVPDSALVMGVYGEHIGRCLEALSDDAGKEFLTEAATMREALEAITYSVACYLRKEIGTSELSDELSAAMDALRFDSGKATLERMRYLERGRELLKEAFDSIISCQPCDLEMCSPGRNGSCDPKRLHANIDAYLKEGQS